MTFPVSLNAIGLGVMTVKSSLDQPFLAEIELIDVGSVPLAGIKVGVADPENFHQIGLERVAALSLLNFKIDKNAKGKLVIKIHSTERMTEPYMELVVDLTWPNGQLYKAYTVLLDPPGYQLVSTRAQSSPTYYKRVNEHHTESGVINKKIITEVQHNPVALKDNKNKTTYGPTIANENVWQIAQRYKTSEIILPQVVLAIVGANPDAFKDGNLNGLKTGMRLAIPATRDMMQVPAELATEEVMAHDKAWNEKSPINHVLSPPYMNAQTINPVSQINANSPVNSEIPTIPKFTALQAITPTPVLPKFMSPNSVVSVVSTNQQQVESNKAQNPERDSNIKAEISITTAAVESVRESNALLMEQLHLLQEQNKKLQKQLDKRDKEIEAIRVQMQLMVKQRLAVASQANSTLANNQSSNLWPLWLLLVVAAGGGFAYWYFKHREQEIRDEPYLISTPVEHKPFIPEAAQAPQKKTIETTISPSVIAPVPEADLTKKTETASPSVSIEVMEQNVSVEHSEKGKKDDEPAEQGVIIKEENIDTSSRPVKKRVSKKESALQKESITAPDSPLEKQEVVNKTDVIPTPVEKIEEDEKEKEKIEEGKTGQEVSAEEAVIEFEPPIEQEPSKDSGQNQSSSEGPPVASDSESISEHSDQSDIKEESSNNNVLEFEPGLHQLISEQAEQKAKPKEEQADDNDQSIDFVSVWSPEQNLMQKNQAEEKNKEDKPAIKEESFPQVEDKASNLTSESEIENKNIDLAPEITEFFVELDEEQPPADRDMSDEPQTEAASKADDSQTASPLKSKAALDTLLALAKTYIGMDDIDSARTSLGEVLEYGSDMQKIEAQRLLDEIKDK